ncbi:MAG: PKD domain-containing protein [Nitrospirota bacterium]
MRNRIAATLFATALVPFSAWAQVNQPPVVTAGADQTIFLGQITLLQATAIDPDGDAIAYWSWMIDSAPSGSSATLSDPTEPNPIFDTDMVGDYVLTVAAADSVAWGAPDSMVIHVVPILPPVAVATANVTTGPAPLTVQFDASQSHDPQGAALTYRWIFGDASLPSVDISPVHTYLQSGVYIAHLVVFSATGLVGEDALEITVTEPNAAPTVSPVASPVSGAAPLAVQFSARASDPDGDPLSFAWDFGDGGTSADANPSHVFAAAGTYTVLLTVSDGHAEVTASLLITVSPAIALSIDKAKIDLKKPGGRIADVSIKADVSAPLPAPDDILAVLVDGVPIVAAPFSDFRFASTDDEDDIDDGVATAYKLKTRDMRVKIDFGAGRLTVHRQNVLLPTLDLANGLTVELRIGDAVVVENILMTAHGAKQYRYHRVGGEE